MTTAGHQEGAELWAEHGDSMLGTQVTYLNVFGLNFEGREMCAAARA